MMPNMDPRAMKSMLAKMGIKTSELSAQRVVIEMGDRDIIISNPQVTRIEAQGMLSFQISGSVEEQEKGVRVEVTDDDVRMVMEKAGISDAKRARQALEDANGDIAEAILSLNPGS